MEILMSLHKLFINRTFTASPRFLGLKTSLLFSDESKKKLFGKNYNVQVI